MLFPKANGCICVTQKRGWNEFTPLLSIKTIYFKLNVLVTTYNKIKSNDLGTVSFCLLYSL